MKYLVGATLVPVTKTSQEQKKILFLFLFYLNRVCMFVIATKNHASWDHFLNDITIVCVQNFVSMDSTTDPPHTLLTKSKLVFFYC